MTEVHVLLTNGGTESLLLTGGGTLRLPTRYKFHEGYTNAVKRPILMQDLLRCN